MRRVFSWTPESCLRHTLAKSIIASLLLLPLASCATGGKQRGNEGGSIPINEKEQVDYSRALIRCHKTGGSRVIKIEGQLRCF